MISLTPMSGLIPLHVIFGCMAVLGGTVALAVRKGGRVHIRAGRLFVITMGLASFLGAVLGLVKINEFYITFHAGILGLTLILSSWLTIRSRKFGLMSLIVGIVNVANVLALIVAGTHALSLPEALLYGFHAGDYFFLAGMAGIAAICDVTLLFRKTLSQKHRLLRHLWRMCLGFFIAAGSAFTGPGRVVFPKALQESGALALPEIIILLLMLFWMARIFLTRKAH